MSPPREIRDAAASVRQRLLNLARERGVDYNLVLQRYAAERFLYRLSVSGEVDRFTLKGAALFRVWAGQELRPTRDVDFLGAGHEDHAAIRTALEAVCGIPCLEDGVVFDPATIRIDDIRDELSMSNENCALLTNENCTHLRGEPPRVWRTFPLRCDGG